MTPVEVEARFNRDLIIVPSKTPGVPLHMLGTVDGIWRDVGVTPLIGALAQAGITLVLLDRQGRFEVRATYRPPKRRYKKRMRMPSKLDPHALLKE